jgi:hypothetical protein
MKVAGGGAMENGRIGQHSKRGAGRERHSFHIGMACHGPRSRLARNSMFMKIR